MRTWSTSGDTRRYCDLFGSTVGGTERYAHPSGTGR